MTFSLGYECSKHVSPHLSTLNERDKAAVNKSSFCIGSNCVPSNIHFYLNIEILGAEKTFLPPYDLAVYLSGEKPIPLANLPTEPKNVGWIEYCDGNGIIKSATLGHLDYKIPDPDVRVQDRSCHGSLVQT